MAVPKNKTSKQRRNSRKAHWKLAAPSMAKCECGEYRVSHRVCPNCGSYNKKTVVEVEA